LGHAFHYNLSNRENRKARKMGIESSFEKKAIAFNYWHKNKKEKE